MIRFQGCGRQGQMSQGQDESCGYLLIKEKGKATEKVMAPAVALLWK
jgi:hypothetical protein